MRPLFQYTIPYAAIVVTCVLAGHCGCQLWFLLSTMGIATAGLLIAVGIFGEWK